MVLSAIDPAGCSHDKVPLPFVLRETLAAPSVLGNTLEPTVRVPDVLTVPVTFSFLMLEGFPPIPKLVEVAIELP